MYDIIWKKEYKLTETLNAFIQIVDNEGVIWIEALLPFEELKIGNIFHRELFGICKNRERSVLGKEITYGCDHTLKYDEYHRLLQHRIVSRSKLYDPESKQMALDLIRKHVEIAETELKLLTTAWTEDEFYLEKEDILQALGGINTVETTEEQTNLLWKREFYIPVCKKSGFLFFTTNTGKADIIYKVGIALPAEEEKLVPELAEHKEVDIRGEYLHPKWGIVHLEKIGNKHRYRSYNIVENRSSPETTFSDLKSCFGYILGYMKTVISLKPNKLEDKKIIDFLNKSFDEAQEK